MAIAAASPGPVGRAPLSSVAKTATTSASDRTCLTASNRRRISPKIAPARSRDPASRKTTGAAMPTSTVPPAHTARQRRITAVATSCKRRESSRPTPAGARVRAILRTVSRRGRIVLLVILSAAAAIRLYRLGYFSYGLDEILQCYWLKGSWAFFWKALRGDAYHPPLDYIVDRLFEGFGPGAAARKLPAVAWGIATIDVFASLLARRIGEKAGLAAAALLAVAPFHVRFSQELRPYSLSLLLLCLSLYALERYLERPRP